MPAACSSPKTARCVAIPRSHGSLSTRHLVNEQHTAALRVQLARVTHPLGRRCCLRLLLLLVLLVLLLLWLWLGLLAWAPAPALGRCLTSSLCLLGAAWRGGTGEQLNRWVGGSEVVAVADKQACRLMRGMLPSTYSYLVSLKQHTMQFNGGLCTTERHYLPPRQRPTPHGSWYLLMHSCSQQHTCVSSPSVHTCCLALLCGWLSLLATCNSCTSSKDATVKGVPLAHTLARQAVRQRHACTQHNCRCKPPMLSPHPPRTDFWSGWQGMRCQVMLMSPAC